MHRVLMGGGKGAKLIQETATRSAIQQRDQGVFRIQLHVKPGARTSQLTDMTEQAVGVQIAAPPRDGEANDEVVRFMAQLLGVRPRQIELVSGHKSREKTILLKDQDIFRDEAALKQWIETHIKKS